MKVLNGQFAREGLDLSSQKKIQRINQAHAMNLQFMPSLQRLNVGHPDNFIDWFCGLLDGDGCFYFVYNQKGVWNFSLKVR
jgi:hypothetical protein